jgi:hypothetical protein
MKASRLCQELEQLKASIPDNTSSQQGETIHKDFKVVANKSVTVWSQTVNVDAHAQCPVPESESADVAANSPATDLLDFVSNLEPFDFSDDDSDIINWPEDFEFELTASPSLPTRSER